MKSKLGRFVIAAFTVALVGCHKKVEPPDQVERVRIPINVIATNDEVLALRAKGADGKALKQTRIDLGPLHKVDRDHDLQNLTLIEHADGTVRREVAFRRDGDAIVADLIGGREYLLFAEPIGRLLTQYKALCNFGQSFEQVPARAMDRLCPLILCTSEMRSMRQVFQEIPELAPMRAGLEGFMGGGGFDRMEVGGVGIPFQGACERCTGFRAPYVIIPTRECFHPNGVIELAPYTIDIEVNQTPTVNDDYVTWAPTFSRIRLVPLGKPTPGDQRVFLSNDLPSAIPSGGDVLFAPFQTPWPVNTTATQPSLELLIPGDGSWVPFVVAGKFGRPSASDKDAVIIVHRNAINGSEIGRKSLMVRIRKNGNNLESGERNRFLQAMQDFRNSGSSGYLMFQELHRLVNTAGDEGHGQPGFYPWHRALLLHVERELQKMDPSVTLPYWNWDAAAPNIFHPDFMGSEGASASWVSEPVFSAGNPLSGWNTDLPFSGGELRRNQQNHSRAPAPSDFMPLDRPPGPSLIDFPDFGSRSLFSAFSSRGELDSHDPAHGWPCAGGNITAPNRSATDPLFFLLHNHVDRQWAYWQWKHNRFGTATAGSLSFSVPGDYDNTGNWNDPGVLIWQQGSFLEDGMWPWDGSSGGSGRSERPINLASASDPDENIPHTRPAVSNAPFPASVISNLWPGAPSMVRPRNMIDYMGKFRPEEGLGFSYDDVPYQ